MNPQESRPWKAYTALGLGLIIIGFSAIFTRSANAPGPVVGFYRMAFGSLFMSIPFALNLRGKPKPPRRGILLAMLAGALFGTDVAAWTSGVVISGATLPTLFVNTNPLWVGLGAWLIFRERLTPGFWVGLAVAMAGAFIVFGADLSADTPLNQGGLLGLLAGFFYGIYFLVAQRGRARLDATSFFFIGTLSSAITLLVIGLALGQPFSGYPSETWINFILQGLIIQAAGWFLVSYAQGFLPASLVSPTLLGQPVITAIFAGPLLGESLRITDILGGIIVLAGIFVVHRSRHVAQASEAKLPKGQAPAT